MAVLLTCPRGHQWQASVDVCALEAPATLVCAVCGAPHLTLPLSRPGAPAARPRIPGYEILGVLGRGGMGVIYVARQARPRRLVALKTIPAGDRARPDELSRFCFEAEAVARLRHPNIVRVYEVGKGGGCPYFALELVEGGSLAQQLAGTPVPARPAAELVATLARAIHYAHRQGIVHRDLKPANVLLAEDGTPKISDFGLAKCLGGGPPVAAGGSRLESDGVIVGTPCYMAPEQAAGKTRETGSAADVYALGAILYELLAGRPPFQAARVLDTLAQVRSQEPVPPSHWLAAAGSAGRADPPVPRTLEAICLKCLQKDPHRRYVHARALADDLHRFLAGEPARARRIRAGPWQGHGATRRRPGVLSA
jgi:serine/threonine-protein kinase